MPETRVAGHPPAGHPRGVSLHFMGVNDVKDRMAGRFRFDGIEGRFWCDIEVGLHIWELLEVLLEHWRTLLWVEFDDRYGFEGAART